MRRNADPAARILEACFGPPGPLAKADGLEPFQRVAAARLRTILGRRGGAVLADSVGLGKTHVAIALIREEVGRGGSVLVTGPAQLRPHWSRHLRGLPRCTWISHTSLSRHVRRTSRPTLVVADEAHAFRNPATKRYAALALLCEHSRVLLLSATPVNNSLLDFYHLAHLFAADDAFVDLGVPDMFTAFDAALHGGSTAAVRRVASAVMVRRTRDVVALHGSGLGFPTAGTVETLHYDLAAAFPGLIEHVRAVVPDLAFAAHSPHSGPVARELMRLGLLKRLESGTWAFAASLRRHIRLLDCFVQAARSGLLFDARTDGRHVHTVDGAMQLAFDPLVLPRFPASLDRDAAIDAALGDLLGLRQLEAAVSAGADPKLDRLRRLLEGELKEESVLIFTEYRSTAHGIWHALAHCGGEGAALIHGSDARLGRGRASRRAIIRRFAPRANGAPAPRGAERVRVLIATDVLAEGLNLQDARVVISWDLPWNPVRLAQRIGRIDRLGSPHASVRALAFMPDPRVDELLRLTRRVRRKLQQIRCVGGDAPAFPEARRTRRFARDLDEAAGAREALHARWIASGAGTGSHMAGRGPSVVASSHVAVQWEQPREAALCCYATASGDALVVLLQDGEPPQIATGAAWSALDHAWGAPPAPPVSDARSRELDRLARRAIRGRAPARRRKRPDHSAATAVLRWLSERPGGATAGEADAADRLLRRLAGGGRAGTELRLARLLSRSGSAHDADHRLERILHTGSARTDAANGSKALVLVGTIVLRPVPTGVERCEATPMRPRVEPCDQTPTRPGAEPRDATPSRG